jgi:hypothetical protein
MIYTLLVLIGIFNAISELSNHGKINHWGQWWSIQAWENKNKWKPYPLWRYWPFIILTDAFHFFKTCWVITMAFAIQIGGLDWYYSFTIYSASFAIFYTLLPYIKFK